MDAFLRERISRHYHLERKGNMERATVFEFDHCVRGPRTAWQERKDATAHFWAYPKEYYGWYKSAKSHHFKMRIPWKIWVAILFLPVAGWVAWSVVSKVGTLADGGVLDAKAATLTEKEQSPPPGQKRDSDRTAIAATSDPVKYLQQFQPVVDELPYSAPVFQGREVVAEPDLYCVASGAGEDSLGEYREASCRCFTEQGTPYQPNKDVAVARNRCEWMARHGFYNPYRPPSGRSERQEEGGGR
jgi:hypothetical protein